MVVQMLNDELSQGTLSEPAIALYLLGNSLNNLTTAEYTEQELELFTEVKFGYGRVLTEGTVQYFEPQLNERSPIILKGIAIPSPL